MKIHLVLFAFLVLISDLSGAESNTVATPVPLLGTNITGPKIQFATNLYNYGRQSSGSVINYTFVFTNIGDQVLEVPVAQGSCHCTTAGDWNKRVEPGQTGTIPVTFNSAGFSGQMTRTVTITSNDKSQPTVVLQMAGTIWKPIEVAPAMAYLQVPPDSAAGVSTVVRIVSNLEEPLTVFPPESNQRAFTAVLKTNEPGKSFELTITATPPFSPGSIQGQISLKTSSTNAPTITVAVVANVQPAITLMPQQINLPSTPLENAITNRLTIHNAGTNFLKLSDPAINAKEVEIKVSEPQPGKLFTVSLIFPRDFTPSPGAPLEFSVKTSHPQYAVIRAPVTWAARTPGAPTPAPPRTAVTGP